MSTARFMQEATEPDAQLRPQWPGFTTGANQSAEVRQT
jgi:hypothetical protein